MYQFLTCCFANKVVQHFLLQRHGIVVAKSSRTEILKFNMQVCKCAHRHAQVDLLIMHLDGELVKLKKLGVGS